MSEGWTYQDPDTLISELRHGRMVLLLLDNSGGTETGIVAMAAELCEAQHITFMARQARGLVCLGLTRSRCDFLNLPMMVEGKNDSAPFTLSIEAAEGIETGISAADRARTVRVAVAPETVAADLVQPGHIFPIAAADGGLLTRADRAEATTDLARLAGLFPAAVFTDVLDEQGNMAEGAALSIFAERHQLPVGRLSDLVNYRLANERTVGTRALGCGLDTSWWVAFACLSRPSLWRVALGIDSRRTRCCKAYPGAGARYLDFARFGRNHPRGPGQLAF